MTYKPCKSAPTISFAEGKVETVVRSLDCLSVVIGFLDLYLLGAYKHRSDINTNFRTIVFGLHDVCFLAF